MIYAIISMIMGILSILFCLVKIPLPNQSVAAILEYVFVIGFGALGIILSFIAKSKDSKELPRNIGLYAGAIGLTFGLVTLIVGLLFFREAGYLS